MKKGLTYKFKICLLFYHNHGGGGGGELKDYLKRQAMFTLKMDLISI